ncbi:GNAT family N-acetyltransferase [Peloplasma aerotolerans]|uniref:GNAT family protein n=1 Tax=Peloplasma aerotolerans TaxID=3044389 RepID=A0AAW6U8D4_9MOLU|nr:GNAT family protein [Mariniplasma sp. M4Ah]MDI6451944.1 GNAT family protein [Mariniplasma sp. M4Ah]MDR4967987.1 GNAT family protein [Acholeplasmataceae bacterium]
MKTLVSKRLILRDLNINDLVPFYSYARKPNIGPNAGWKPHTSIEESSKILKMMISDKEVWGIELKSTNQLIGTIGLHVRNFDNAVNNVKEVGYVLDDAYWGQGLMVEAVNAVLDYAFINQELDAVFCGHAKHNIQSKRVIEKTNFLYTHTEPRDHFDGTKVDIMMYELKRLDYLGGKVNDKSKNEIRL